MKTTLANRKRKNHFELHQHNQFINKKRIKSYFEKINSFLNDSGLSLTGDINIVASESSEVYKININEESDTSHLHDLSKSLAIKDLNNISDRAFNRMRIDLDLKEKLPTLNKIRKHRNELKSYQRVFENESGVYISIKQKLEYIINKMHINKKLENISSDTITIKFCGDGSQISKTLNIYNFTMSIIDDKNICKTSKGHYIVGVFSIDENYEDISRALAPIVNEINTLDEIRINHEAREFIYKIKTYISADLKAIAQLLGIASATSKYPCPYCKINFTATKAQEYGPVEAFINQLNEEWDLGLMSSGCQVEEHNTYRTMTEANRLIKLNKNKTEERKGYKNLPMFKTIDYRSCIPDVLHLFLRITDRLEKLFLIEIDTMDKNKRSKIQGGINDQPFLKKYKELLELKINIKKVTYKGCADNDKYVARELNGNEKWLLFTYVCESEINCFNTSFPEIKKIKEIHKIWTCFFKIIKMIKDREHTDYLEIKNLTRDWMNQFLKVYAAHWVTPYMHIFLHHLWWFYKETCGQLNDFNAEGSEKLNETLRTFYNRSSTKKDVKKSLFQIMEKQNRCEKFRIDGLEYKQKKKYRARQQEVPLIQVVQSHQS